MSLICHIHTYAEYNQQWNVFSAFNPSNCTHTWSSGQPTLRRPGSSWGFGALLKGLISVMDNSCRSRDSNPQPRVTSPTLYPLGHDLRQSLCVIYEINNVVAFSFALINSGSHGLVDRKQYSFEYHAPKNTPV